MTSSGCGATPAGTRWTQPEPRWRPRRLRAWRACRDALDALLAVTVAPTCAACRTVLDSPLNGPVCGACWATIRPLASQMCPTCGTASSRDIPPPARSCAACRRRPSAVDWGRVATDYGGALRDVVHAFKYEGRRSLAAPLGRVLAEAGAGVLAGADCVVPVPLHPWKRLSRGFNQAADLAATLGPPVVHALWRVRFTPPQVGLSAPTRRRNVHGAFAPAPFLGARRGHVTGRVVVLVDDVRTTGATLHECARVLKGMGAREVRSLALAQAPVREPAVRTIAVSRVSG